ncbi:hypothetical protein Tco_1094907, partial [Tanacetum coccineum]
MEGAMIIEAEVGGSLIHCMYVDGGYTSEVLYEHYFNRLCPEIRNQMIPATTPLSRFSGEISWPLGKIKLLVTIGDAKHSTTAWMNFMIVHSPSSYNGIFGRLGIRKIQAVPLTIHKMLKFPVTGVRKKKIGKASDRSKAILEEVTKFVEAEIMREVYYHDWLSNPVL